MPDASRVQLVIPASVEYVLLARLTLAGIGSRLGLPYDEIEDLRVIATEACRLLIGEAEGEARSGEVAITCTAENGSLIIEARGELDPPPSPPGDDDLALHLLTALSDEHELDFGPASRIRIVKSLAG